MTSDIRRGSGGDRTLACRLRAGCSTFELQIQYEPLAYFTPNSILTRFSARQCGREELNLQAYGGRFTAVGAHQCPASTNQFFVARESKTTKAAWFSRAASWIPSFVRRSLGSTHFIARAIALIHETFMAQRDQGAQIQALWRSAKHDEYAEQTFSLSRMQSL